MHIHIYLFFCRHSQNYIAREASELGWETWLQGPVLRSLTEVQYFSKLQKMFNLPPCKISSFQIFLKIMRVKAFKLQNIRIISLKIGFLFPVPADLALICWLKVETFLNDLTYGKPSSRVVPAYPQLFCNSGTFEFKFRFITVIMSLISVVLYSFSSIFTTVEKITIRWAAFVQPALEGQFIAKTPDIIYQCDQGLRLADVTCW